ncbi:hypothetical protein [Hyalangium versicolor]|uniref:hypothetical protein n=1 Tax=Hyalangium versicolor TaxID=2861190 RepID=UPI001CC9F9D7|nr:hypothetical protein [Hyalangium versicolor]
MFRSLPHIVVALVTLLLAQGCSRAAVVQGHPSPNIDLPEKSTSLEFVMDESIQDQYPAEVDGKQTVNVSEWRATLLNGFSSGFKSAFKPAADKADLTLQLNEAVLSFSPTAFGRYGAIQAAEAQVRYKARLLDSQGQVLRRSTGTVSSKKPITDNDAVTSGAANAVESMYEKIAQDFFSETPSAPAPETPPAQ